MFPSLQAAKEASLKFAQQQCDRINAVLANRYTLNFDAWKTEVLAGKRDNRNPPLVPYGWKPFLYPDGFTYETRSSQPACDARQDIPADYSKPFIPFTGDGDTKRNAPAGDTMPVGYIATLDDGSKWLKKVSITPFGTATYYERVS